MKKAKKSTAKASSKRRARTLKATQAKLRTSRKQVRANRRKATPRKAVRTQAKQAKKSSARLHARSAAKLAASVFSRRAAKVKALASPIPVERPPLKAAPKAIGSSAGKQPKSGTAKPGRGHGAASLPGNRPVVRVSRVPQFTYMRAPGADSGFDVGDPVEVFCDHEQDGERVRGWIKGVVVQVDNKLVAVQFRSDVFLTDGWMVPDRILWYSLSSDQIRNIGVGKKGARVAIPEY